MPPLPEKISKNVTGSSPAKFEPFLVVLPDRNNIITHVFYRRFSFFIGTVPSSSTVAFFWDKSANFPHPCHLSQGRFSMAHTMLATHSFDLNDLLHQTPVLSPLRASFFTE